MGTGQYSAPDFSKAYAQFGSERIACTQLQLQEIRHLSAEKKKYLHFTSLHPLL